MSAAIATTDAPASTAPPDLTSPIEYDLQPIRVPVKYRGRQLVLTESGDAVIKWRNSAMGAAVLGGGKDGGKPIGVKNLADAEPILVAGCLFENKDNDLARLDPKYDSPVSLSFVRGLPPKFLDQLFERAKAINGVANELTKGDDETEKDGNTQNRAESDLGKDSPESTGAGSD